jgi:hypothetical protein
LSGTSDTKGGTETRPVADVGCACGRVHSRPHRRRSPKGSEPDLAERVTDAIIAGNAEPVDGFGWSRRLSRDCAHPVRVAANDGKQLFAERYVRCRKCKPCLRARTNYWGFAGMEQTRLAAGAGGRTWFGTLTLDADWQEEFLHRARMAHGDPCAAWWDEPHCDERFARVRDELLKELQKYWKRLRKAGHRFKYLAVFERHKSGLPHVHWLLHEQTRILKKDLQAEWPYGFTNVSIVGGRSAGAADPRKAAWYVVKYLSKSVQSRQVASSGYKPVKRSRA